MHGAFRAGIGQLYAIPAMNKASAILCLTTWGPMSGRPRRYSFTTPALLFAGIWQLSGVTDHEAQKATK